MRLYKVTVRRTTFAEVEIEVEAKGIDHARDAAELEVRRRESEFAEKRNEWIREETVYRSIDAERVEEKSRP